MPNNSKTINKISSLKNPHIKEILLLRKKRERIKQKLFLIEGYAEIKMALDNNINCKTFINAPFFAKNKKNFLNIKTQNTIIVSRQVFKHLSYRENPDGYLAVAEIKEKTINKFNFTQKDLILVVEGIEKPGNLGAILRTADATNVNAVFVCDPELDIYNPNVIRSSLGTVFSNKVIQISSKNALEWLKNKNFTIYASTPRASKNYYNFDFQRPLAIVVGAEHKGLTETWLKKDLKHIKLPMLGKIDSLNVSVSAAILLYEAIKPKNV